ncbi:protein phosphatase 2C domain-containing protein [Flammeovirga sp. SubArs3]|uniref:protein phosphatase 2C domain-containing protein n=1 Tax=Flammeovirga sp. SubArs3 TaxID=2995316 RepID=UPI00248D18AF|nr:protein phosphatase 2C domain-containing protein [Flammeovirga sp. SubArs3]
MKVYYKKGTSHANHNEDAYFYKHLNEDIVLLAVMDGCSSGKEAYFASTLFSKILKKISLGIPNQTDLLGVDLLDSYSLSSLGLHITHSFFIQLKRIQQSLLLEYSELASTLLLMLVDKKQKKVWVLVAGDGYVMIDHQLQYYDYNNRPDYICYHLSNSYKEWLHEHTEIYEATYQNIVGLSTDGVKEKLSFPNKINRSEIETLLEDKEVQFKDDVTFLIFSDEQR